MISTKKILSLLLVTLVLFSVGNFVHAATPSGGTPAASGGTPAPSGGTPAPSGGTPDISSSGCGGALCNPLKAPDLTSLISDLLGYVVKLGAVLLTLMLIYVGFLFVLAQGNDEKLKTARSALIWTVVGGLILLGAQAIASAIAATVGAITA
jgi:hypothetical protein